MSDNEDIRRRRAAFLQAAALSTGLVLGCGPSLTDGGVAHPDDRGDVERRGEQATCENRPELEEEAKARFLDGQKAFEVGDYGAAAEHFEEAYQVCPLPALAYNLGRTYEHLGELNLAGDYYARVIEDPEADPRIRDAAAERKARMSGPSVCLSIAP